MPNKVNGIEVSTSSERLHRDLDPGAAATYGAAFDEAGIHMPVGAIYRSASISAVAKRTGGYTGIGRRGDVGMTQSGLYQIGGKEKREQAIEELEGNPDWITKENAVDVIESNGFSTSDIPVSDLGANYLVLDMVIQRKKAERKRQELLAAGSSRRPVSTFMLSLGASMLDPVNMAAGFIPIGQTRYAIALNNAASASRPLLARALVRAKFGVMEGAIGTALLEPLMLNASSQDMLDYTLDDALTSIAFGGIAGGGMHMGFGYIGDRLKLRSGVGLSMDGPKGAMPEALDKLDPAVLRDNMKASVYSSLQNRDISVQELLSASGVKLMPGVKVESIIPENLTFRKLDDGRVEVTVKGTGYKTLDELLSDDAIANEIKDIARQSKDIEDLVKKIESIREKGLVLDERNVNELRKILSAEEAMPLSTFIERSGGLRRDDLIDWESGKQRRPGLFKENGLTLKDAVKKAREAGYLTNKTTVKNFVKRLNEDIDGNLIFTKGVESKLKKNAELLRSIEAFEAANSKEPSSLIGYGDHITSVENLHSYDPDFDRLYKEVKESADPIEINELKNEVETLTTYIDQQRQSGFDIEDISNELARIESVKQERIKAYELAANCRF